MAYVKSEARSKLNQLRPSEVEREAFGGLSIANARSEAMSGMDCSTMALIRSEAAKDGEHGHKESGEERHQPSTALVRSE